MTTQTVAPTETAGQPLDGTVAELRRIADALEDLGTLPPGERVPYLSLSLLLDTVDGVDQAARAVLGKQAKPSDHGGQWFHLADGAPRTGDGRLCIQTTIPPVDERQAEIEKLRAEVAALRAQTAVDAAKFAGGWTAASAQAVEDEGGDLGDKLGIGYSRDEAEDPRPVSPARVPLHTGSVVAGDRLVVDGDQ